ncbi:MAG TPA: lipopolysaccharide heptosyltransferase II [Pirellulales bacterium]|nr:lipopolysaccharide heptosyltransferase II [Pirellulales bacterium]
MPGDRWADAQKLLCVRLDSLGDVLLTTPAIGALKTSRPGRSIALLTSASGVEVAPLLPDVDDVIRYDAPWMKHTADRQNPTADERMIAHLRAERFDAAVIFTVYSQNPLPAALLCYLAEIPLRAAHCRENPYQLLTDWVRESEPEQLIRHEVRRQLDLAAAVGAHTPDERLRLSVSLLARRHAGACLNELGIDAERPWAVVHPGATAASRRWPAERFAELAGRLAREEGWQIVFTGDRGEQPLIEQIQRLCGAATHSLAGRLRLDELAALIEAAPLLISNNTGPVHVAAAVGTPVVDLYALTNPQHTPWQVPHRVLFYDVPCKYCYKSICPEAHHDCLGRVTVAEVLHAALELYDERRFTQEAAAVAGAEPWRCPGSAAPLIPL